VSGIVAVQPAESSKPAVRQQQNIDHSVRWPTAILL